MKEENERKIHVKLIAKKKEEKTITQQLLISSFTPDSKDSHQKKMS